MFGAKQKIEIVDFEKEAKRREKKAKRQQKFEDVKTWCQNNPELALLLASAGIGGVTGGTKIIAKSVSKHQKLKLEHAQQYLRCYDRSAGHYWTLRREITNDEWLMIARRKANGEKLVDILDELRVLK